MAANVDISSLEKDPRLFLYTSLTSGSSHIITATSRLETILKANKLPFLAIDTATDEKARRLWQRRSRGKKLPGLVKDGFVLGDLEEIEEWNEFGELKENIGPCPPTTAVAGSAQMNVGINIAPPITVHHPFTGQGGASLIAPRGVPVAGEPAQRIALPGAAEIAAMAKAKKAAAASEKAAAGEKAKEPDLEKQTGDTADVGSKKIGGEEVSGEKDEEVADKEVKVKEGNREDRAEEEVTVESQTGETNTAPVLTTASGEVVEPITDTETSSAVDAAKVVSGDDGKPELVEETKTVDPKEVKEDEAIEKDVTVQSETGQTSTAPALTTASGEVVQPITDTETSGVADAVKEVSLDDDSPESAKRIEPAEPAADKQEEVTQEAEPEAGDVETSADDAEEPTEQSNVTETTKAAETSTDEAEEPTKQSSLTETTKAVDDLKLEAAREKTQDQDAKAPEHASDSVED